MTINSQQSLHRSNIVLVLFLDRLQVFQPHFSQLLGFRNRFPSIQLAEVLRIRSAHLFEFLKRFSH